MIETQESDQTRLLAIFEAGVARSAEKLSALSGVPWHIHIVSLDMVSGERFKAILARDSRDYIGVRFSTPGERFLVLFSEESGEALLNASAFASQRAIPGMDSAALAEISNILINGLAGELADRQGMVRVISSPQIASNRKAELCEQAFGDLPSSGRRMVNVLIHLSSPDLSADCTLLVRLDALSANFLLNAPPPR